MADACTLPVLISNPVSGTRPCVVFTEAVTPSRPRDSFLASFTSARVWLLVGLGYASGLPYLLTGGTLSAWMTNAGVDLKTIGLFAFVRTPYTFKFLWAPLLDRFNAPLLGRRRGWLFLCQVFLVVTIVLMALSEPATEPGRLALLAVVLAFVAASQDIVADAYRTDILEEHERASGAATFVMGYRIALLFSGALALVLSDHVSWRTVYLLMALLMAVGGVITLLAPEPAEVPAPRTLGRAVLEPLVDYFRREGAWVTLAFLVLYKVGDAVANQMTTPFLLRHLAFSNTEVGLLNQTLGLVSAIVGGLIGGGFVARLGLRRALFVFGILQAVTNLLFLALALVGKSYGVLVLAIGADNVTGGLGTAAFTAFLMSLCNRRYSATQYALLSALATVGSNSLGASSGYLVDTVGWPLFFLLTVAFAVPALLLLSLLPENMARPEGEATERTTALTG